MTRYYWDTCAFISRLQGDPRRITSLEFLTDEAAAGRIEIVTSTLTVAEACYLNKECSEEELAQDVDLIASYFDNDYITLVQVTKAIATEAARIVRKHGVKPPDAIHLATAIAAKCPTVHTYDGKKLLKLDNIVGDPPLRIVIPQPQVQTGLFGDDGAGDNPEEPDPANPCSLASSGWCITGKPFDCSGWLTPSRRVWGRSSALQR